MTREELKAHCEKQIEMCETWAVNNGEKPSGNIYEEHKLILELLEQEPCEMTAEEYRQRMIQAFHNAGTGELVALCVLPAEKEFEYLEWLLKNHYKKEPCEDWHDVPSYEMTLEQARQEVKDLRKKLVEYLEQEPCGDAISRKSIKQKLREHHDFFINAYGGFSNLPQDDKSRVDEITNCIAMVVNEPSVTPQQNMGKWILSDGYWRCSNCREKALLKFDKVVVRCREYIPIKSNYCPNCGKKMEVEE